MAGKTPRSIESLKDTEQRLKRALELRGEPNLQLSPTVVPVVVVGNADQGGYRASVERSWAYGESVAAVALNLSKLALKASGRDIIIDRIMVQGTGANSDARIGIMGHQDADPFAISQNNVRWTERLTTTNEVTGILTQPHSTDALEYGVDLFRGVAPGDPPFTWFGPIVLQDGGKVIVQGTTVNQGIRVNFFGRAL